MVLSANAAQQVGRLPPETLNEGPDAIVAVLAPDDALSVDLRGISEGYWARVPDPAGAREATWQLLRRLQWRPGGVVAKWINRPISIRLSRHLVRSRITPNQTTMFAFAVGLLGIISILRGGYWNAVLGTALLQANSILDGIDGELARIRHQTSEFGAYLDSVCDEVLNAGLLVAVGWALTHFKHGGDPTYQWLGLFAGAAAFAHALVHWHCKWKHGLGFYWWFEAYKPRKAVQRSRSPFAYFKKLFWKESYLFLFMWAAVFDLMEVMMWISGVAAAAVYVLFFIHIPIKRARW
jgi:phosphatidylglycerophosphate synthase